MKLLVITQTLDTNHPILGFFHRWVEELAKQTEAVTVIALQVGTYNLPKNVTVYSLGKETGQSRIKYLYRFFTLILRFRHQYDSVFVHMNQIYVILGAPLWKLMRKPVGLWYAHGKVSRSLEVATDLTDMVLTSTPQGFGIDTPKRVLVGQGVDMQHFQVQARTYHPPYRLITVGRVSPSKQLETLIDAVAILKANNVPVQLQIIGVPITPAEEEYAIAMREYVVSKNVVDAVVWYGPATQATLPALLADAHVFVHDGATESLDKVLVEALATGLPTISSNLAYQNLEPAPHDLLRYAPRDADALAANIERVLRLTDVERQDVIAPLVDKVRSMYSVEHLVSGIVQQYEIRLHRLQ